VLVDTGPLVALYRQRDQYHSAAVEQFGTLSPPGLTCWPVVVEAAYLLRDEPDAVPSLLASFAAGLLRLLPIEQSEFSQIARIIEKYGSLRPQLADASLVYLAQRENLDTIFTFDRRDFSVYRVSGNRVLTIVPQW
jgi:predicted nucleic acid-binding protein